MRAGARSRDKNCQSLCCLRELWPSRRTLRAGARAAAAAAGAAAFATRAHSHARRLAASALPPPPCVRYYSRPIGYPTWRRRRRRCCFLSSERAWRRQPVGGAGAERAGPPRRRRPLTRLQDCARASSERVGRAGPKRVDLLPAARSKMVARCAPGGESTLPEGCEFKCADHAAGRAEPS